MRISIFSERPLRRGESPLLGSGILPADRTSVRLVVVKADHARDQLTEVLEALTIIPNPVKRMTLCLRCNAPLEAIPKETAEGLVPVYVYQKYRQFRRCPLCGRIFWPGTHRERVEERLRTQFPYRTLSF